VPNDYYRVREACLAAEQRFGLRRTAPGDHTAAHRPTRAENEKAAGEAGGKRPASPSHTRVSTATAAASSEEEFFTRLQRAGGAGPQAIQHPRPGRRDGLRRRSPGRHDSGGRADLVQRGKLAADLTLPKLRRRWHAISVTPTPHPPGQPPRPNAPPSGTRPHAPQPRPLSTSVTSPPPATRPQRPTPRVRRPTPCTRQQPLWAAASSVRPQAPATVPPACHTAGFPAPPWPGRTCAERPAHFRGRFRRPRPHPGTIGPRRQARRSRRRRQRTARRPAPQRAGDSRTPCRRTSALRWCLRGPRRREC
jgi:hypothetical protein